MLKTCLLAASAILLSGAAYADTVVLKTGQQLEGKILKRDDAGIELEVEYGTMHVPADKILRIEEDTPEVIAAREQKAEAERQFAAKMKAEGKVEYKGKWITEKERKTEEEKLAAAKKKKDEEKAAAKKKADEALAARKKAEEEKKLAAARQLEQWRAQQLAAQANSTGNSAADRYRQRRDRSRTGDSERAIDQARDWLDNTGLINNNSRRGTSYSRGDINEMIDQYGRGSKRR